MRRNRIVDYRNAKGWTQSDLARRIGVTPEAVCQYESGKRLPRIATLFRLTELFECTTEDLYPRGSA